MITREALNVLYEDDKLVFGEADGRFWLLTGDISYRLTDYPEKRCLYLKGSDRSMTTILHCFTLTELCWLIRTGETLTMVSGSVRDVRGIFKLIHKAFELSMPSVDTGFLEVHCYIDYMREHGAVSAQTAVDRRDGGIEDPALLTPFIDARIIGNTLKGRYYLRNPGEEETARTQDQNFYNRVLSNQVRFGAGYRRVLDELQYFAWHGYPNRNDDFITYAQISEEEYEQINREYPQKIDADRDTAERFREKYVNGHEVLLEGWNVTLKSG